MKCLLHQQPRTHFLRLSRGLLREQMPKGHPALVGKCRVMAKSCSVEACRHTNNGHLYSSLNSNSTAEHTSSEGQGSPRETLPALALFCIPPSFKALCATRLWVLVSFPRFGWAEHLCGQVRGGLSLSPVGLRARTEAVVI